MQISHPEFGIINVPDNFWDLDDSAKDAAVAAGLRGTDTGPSTGGLLDATRSNDTVDSMESDNGDTDSSGEAVSLANKVLQESKQEFEEFKETVSTTSIQDIDEATKEVAGEAGGLLGKGTRWIVDKASDILDHPDWKKFATTVGEGNQLKAKTHLKQGEIVGDFLEKYGPQALQTASDLALLYIVWAAPIIPVQYKVAAALDTAATLTGLTGPSIMKFVEHFAKGFGTPLPPEFVEGSIDKFETLQKMAPRLVIRKFLHDATRSDAADEREISALNDMKARKEKLENPRYGLNNGGMLDRKISKIYKEGKTAPGQAYAIAKSMGYNKGGLLRRCK